VQEVADVYGFYGTKKTFVIDGELLDVCGIHLASADANKYIFDLFFKDTICLNLPLLLVRATCGNNFKCALQKDLEQWCSQSF